MERSVSERWHSCWESVRWCRCSCPDSTLERRASPTRSIFADVTVRIAANSGFPIALIVPHPDVDEPSNARATPSPILSAVPFEGVTRDVVMRWKYHRESALTRYLGELVVVKLTESDVLQSIDVVTWAPTSSRRRRQRGYDQAELLARHVARRIRRPCRRLLIRGHGGSQTGRGRQERIASGPRFHARPVVRGLGVLVVDDVVTTGSTLRAAEIALKRAGHLKVVLLAVCSTPVEGRLSLHPTTEF